MTDPRIQNFAQIICKCLEIVEEDVVLIWGSERSSPLIIELQKEIYTKGAYPEIRIGLEQMRYTLLKYGQEKHFRYFSPGMDKDIEVATKFIYVESAMNPYSLKIIEPKKFGEWQRTLEPYHRKLNLVPSLVTIFPNVHYANNAGMTLEEYEDVFYKAVSVDLEKLHHDYYPIEQMLSRGNKFRIRTSNTDLTFELGDRHFTMHSLLKNLPAGELYCAPLEDSVTGYIRFEQPVAYQGKKFHNIYLEFCNGKMARVECESEKHTLEKILAMDEGAHKIGEFGFGLNPELSDFTNDILLDEKVTGTLHFALGNAYSEVGGTNHSTIHFDMIKDMRGDGEILMDGRAVYRNGRFCA